MNAFLFLLVHALGLAASLRLGGWLAGDTLTRLRLVARDPARPGAPGAGQYIGYAERFVLYLAVVAQQPALIAVLFGLKTLVRYPEVKASVDREHTKDGATTGRFAEYYLVGTLVSMAVGLACPLAAMGLLRLAGN